MSRLQKTLTPFSGNYYDSDGILRNIDGELVVGKGFKNPNTQFNGNYYDHEGNIKNIKELLDKLGTGGSGVPNGGSSGQVLAKVSNTDGDVAWVNPVAGTEELPTGGTTGQILIKNSSTDGDVAWSNTPFPTLNATYVRLYSTLIIGDGTQTEFNISHGLNSFVTFLSVKSRAGRKQVVVDNENTNENTIKLIFALPIPLNEQYDVYILSPVTTFN